MPGASVLSPPLELRVRRVPGAPLVSVRVWLRGGGRVEAIPGLALVTGRMLSEGTRDHDFRAIAEQLEARGAALATSGSIDVHGVALDALASDWELALEWVAEILFASAFPADRLAWVRLQAEAELESQGDQAETVAGLAFLDQLYTPHPRARPMQGDVASLARITPDDCRAFHRRSLASGLVIAVTGEIDELAVTARVEQLFAGLGSFAGPAGEPFVAHPPAVAIVGRPEQRCEVSTPAVDQAHLYLGHLTVERGHPDYAAMQLLGVILGAGAGLTGRIPTRIREREGLAYTAFAHTTAGAGFDPGRLVAYVGTSPATVDRAVAGVREELARLAAEGPSARELEEARSYLLGREPFRRETARQWAELLADSALYQVRGDDQQWVEQRLREVDLACACRVAAALIRPEAVQVTVGLPAAKS